MLLFEALGIGKDEDRPVWEPEDAVEIAARALVEFERLLLYFPLARRPAEAQDMFGMLLNVSLLCAAPAC